ncbi:MAG: YggS family pyridoxal phosphate-dependent enzyme [Planctomycetota bacterium]
MGEIAANLAHIRANIARALRRVGEPDREVTIVAVTKNAPAAVVEAVATAGLRDVGENRVQEALGKAPEVRVPVRWHLIGHLQRNKVQRAVGLFEVIHSVDSPRLVEALAATGRPMDILLQVNVSAETSKHGVAPSATRALWQLARGSASLRVTGLMTMGPLVADPEAVRPVFRALRELRDDLNRAGDGPPLRELSMGMSGDYAVAVEEGATLVRIGTALVGGIAPEGR